MDFENTLKASASAMPFWFPAFYISYIQRASVLDYRIVPLTAKTIAKSFALNAAFQPLFPFVNVCSKALQSQLPNSSSLSTKTVSYALVSASTAYFVNPFEVKMLSLRTNMKPNGFSGYFRGVSFLALRNSIVGVNLFVAYPEIVKSAPNVSPIASSICCAAAATMLVMPLDVVSAIYQKEQKYSSIMIMQRLKSLPFSTFFTGSTCRILSTAIEIYCFNKFYAFYQR